MTLQTFFYVLGIIFMIVNLLLIVALLSAVLVIKSKINHVSDTVSQKVNQVKDITNKANLIFRTAKHFAKR